MKKLDAKDLGDMVIYRGLGWNQAEIAEELGVTPGAISYQLAQVKAQAKVNGVEKVFISRFFNSRLGATIRGDRFTRAFLRTHLSERVGE